MRVSKKIKKINSKKRNIKKTQKKNERGRERVEGWERERLQNSKKLI